MKSKNKRTVAAKWVEGMPSREIDIAWLRVLDNPRDNEEGARIVFGMRHPIDWFWCEVNIRDVFLKPGGLDCEDFEAIETVITHWMPEPFGAEPTWPD